jgi:predicted PurR-regulated permease PerM/phosphoglycolate phosphatase-like HAD superfamily hydrolase
MTSRRWGNVTKIIVVATLAILAIVLLITFRVMIIPTIVAFLVAFILSYPVNWVQRRTGWPRGITVGLFYLVILAAVVIIPAVFIPRVDISASVNNTITDLVDSLQNETFDRIIVIGPYQLSPNNAFAQLGDLLQGLAVSTGNPFTIFRNFTTGVLTVLYVVVLSFWILKDFHRLQLAAIERVPSEYQEEMRQIGTELGAIWDAFLRGQIVLAFVVGIITWIVLSILGMPNAGGLALLGAFMEFLPTIGPGISMAIGTTYAFFRGSTHELFGNNLTFAIVVLVAYNIITWFESAYLIPRLIGSRVRLHPAVTFVAIISGALSFGLLGVLLATPVVASSRVLLDYVYHKLLDQNPFESADVGQPTVRIRGLIAGRKIEGIIFDLDGTLTDLDWYMADSLVDRTTWLNRLVSQQRRERLARRVMLASEGIVNFLIKRLERLDLDQERARFQPLFDQLRGYPPAGELAFSDDTCTVLHALHHQYKLALVTTRRREELDQFLAHAGLDPNTFDTIVSREDVRNLQPHSEALLLAAEQMDLAPENVLVVCDSDGSLRSGGAANMATGGILGGLSEADDFTSADLVLAAPGELTDWL